MPGQPRDWMQGLPSPIRVMQKGQRGKKTSFEVAVWRWASSLKGCGHDLQRCRGVRSVAGQPSGAHTSFSICRPLSSNMHIFPRHTLFGGERGQEPPVYSGKERSRWEHYH